jgi:hypothetical protein
VALVLLIAMRMRSLMPRRRGKLFNWKDRYDLSGLSDDDFEPYLDEMIKLGGVVLDEKGQFVE